MNQKVLGRIVTNLGCEGHIVSNGREAVDAFRTGAFDLVLMDCQMPEVDGFAATERIRALEEGGRTPIIAVTANAMQGDRERCLASGMDDYITKPINRSELITLLERWIAFDTPVDQPPIRL